MEGWKVNFLKVVRVSHQPIFPLAYTCPTQFIFLDFLVAPKTSLVHLISSFFYFNATRTIKNSLPLIPMGPTPKERKALTNKPPSLTETIYLSLRRNQTLTKISVSVVGKYICLFSVMGILMVEWFALVSIRNTEICSIVFLSERIYMSAFT